MDELSVILSIIAVIISACSLTWNVVKEFAIRPRLRVIMRVAQTVTDPSGGCNLFTSKTGSGISPNQAYIVVEAVNLGPLKIECKAIVATKGRGCMGWISDGERLAIILSKKTEGRFDSLPKNLDPGESITLKIPICRNEFYTSDVWKYVGLTDNFGRIHFVTVKDVKRVRKFYKTQFREQLQK